MHINHFSYGLLTPTLSYTLSVLGCLLGLICTVRARNAPDNRRRGRWLLLAAWAIGGTGIWVMHFMAMIGFSVVGLSIRYDLTLTAASWITAVVVVAIGLFIVGFGRPHAVKILLGGVITGIGVAAMHYTGMAAMRIPATITYDRVLVAASVAIAVVAATVALWFTVTLRRGWVLLVAALIMGVAVNGMHFTGMFAMRVSDAEPQPISGIMPVAFLAPIVVFVVAVLVVLMVALLNRSGSGDEGGGGSHQHAEPPGPQPISGPPARQQPSVASAFGNRAR